MHVRKLLLRLKRDVALHLASGPRLLVVLTLVLTLIALSIRIHAHRVNTVFRPTTCICPVPTTATLFQRTVLRSSRFVARVRFISSTRDMHVFRVVTLYRGHVRAASYPILIPRALAAACSTRTSAKSRAANVQVNAHFLVVGGPLTASDHPQWPQASVVSPRTQCVRETSVRLVAWQVLSHEVRHMLREDDGNGNFWRANGAEAEFVAALSRARNITRGSSQILDSAQMRHGVGEEWWLNDGVSIIAACKDRSTTLLQAVSTWLRADVQEIVLVDWSSSPSILSVLPQQLVQSPKLTLLTVSGQRHWVLSRAYNLAARAASYTRLLKLDCDTRLALDFFPAHPLPRSEFYSGDWRQLRSEVTDELHVNGLLYVYRDDFLATGGYDERIVTYGWDDSDISERLSRIRRARRLNYDKVHHIAHNASLRVARQASILPPDNPHAAAVEIQRNRILLTKFNLPLWRASALHTLWNISPVYAKQSQLSESRLFHLVVSAANEVTASSALVSDADALDVSKRSIRLVLHRFGVQLLPKTLSLDFYKDLITKVAYPNRYAEVLLSLRGGCMSRLIAQAASQHASSGTNETRSLDTDEGLVSPPEPYVGWRLQALWRHPDTECSCRFSSLFDARDAELISGWFDKLNTIAPTQPMAAEQPTVNISSVLHSFNSHSKEKQTSEETSRWINRSRAAGEEQMTSRLLIAQLACDVDPSDVSQSRRNSLRQLFRRISPTAAVQEAVVASLEREEQTLLDGNIFSEDRWASLLGEQAADRVKRQFADPGMQQMYATWGVNIATSGHLRHRLDRRAAALSVAMQFAQVANGQASSHINVSTDTTEAIVQLKKQVDILFLGCQASPAKFLDAYPELSLILAVLFSSKLCL